MNDEPEALPLSDGDCLGVSIEGPLMILTINRPSARNAMTLEVAQRIEAALAELDERVDLQIGVITGAGQTFCAGMDLKDFAKGLRPSTPQGGFAGFVERPPRKPMIAAVEGYAVAGELAMTGDFLNAQRGYVRRYAAASVGAVASWPRGGTGAAASSSSARGKSPHLYSPLLMHAKALSHSLRSVVRNGLAPRPVRRTIFVEPSARRVSVGGISNERCSNR